MIENLYRTESNYLWMIIHVLLGLACTINSWFLIIWVYLFIISSFNKVLSSLMFKNSINIFIPFLVYVCSFEVFGRMLKTYPYIPWELSKYLIISSCILLLLTGYVKKPFSLGIFIIVLLVPGAIIDQSNQVTYGDIASNLLGPFSMAILLFIIGQYELKSEEFDAILKLIWYSTIPMLIYTMINTPDYSSINFSLGAKFATTGGFGSNQVSTIIGIGMFLSFYAWMNKLLFSGNHSLDGLFIGLFAYQGFLTFSRGGMMVGIIAILFYYYFFRSSKAINEIIQIRRLRPLLFFTFAIIIVISSFLIIQNISGGNLSHRFSGETRGTISGERIKTINTMTTGRYDLFIADLELWSKYFVFGTGAGASSFLRGRGLDGIAPHTEISRLLAEHGIFGFFILIILLLCLFRIAQMDKNNIYRAILFVLFLIATGTALHSAMRTFVTPVFLALSMIKIKDFRLD